MHTSNYMQKWQVKQVILVDETGIYLQKTTNMMSV
jgi:hypothetical protein